MAEERDRQAPVTFGVFDFFPWALPDQQGNLEGMSVDLVAKLSEISGIEITPRFQPVARVFRDAELGLNDLVLAYKLPSMVPGVEFIADLGCLTASVVMNKNVPVSGIEDLHDKRIAYLPGGYFWDKLRSQIGVKEYQVDTNREMIALLALGRVDGFVTNNFMLGALIRKGPPYENFLPINWRNEIGQEVPFEKVPVAIGMSINSKNWHLRNRLREAITHGVEEGAFDAIYRKWGSLDGWSCK